MGLCTQIALIVLIALLPNIHGWWLGRPRTSASVNVHRDPYTGQAGVGGSVSVTWGGRKRKRSISAGGLMPECVRACDSSSPDTEICTFVCTKICVPASVGNANMVPKMVPKVFKMFDENENGMIELEEVSAATHVPMVCAIEAFQIADDNDDDRINPDEFNAAPWNFIEIDEAEARALSADPDKYRRLLEDIPDENEFTLNDEE